MYRLSSFLALAFLALALSACSGVDLVNALTPRGGYDVRRDIAYGPGPRNALDLYVPDEARDDAPIVVFFYGGGWDSGDKADFRFAGQALASRGYITAIPDYRIYPEVQFPDFVRDGAAAVAWVKANLRRPDGSPRPLILVGHSAGAQIAALLNLDERYLDAAGAPLCRTVSAAVGLAGPYDFLPLTEERYIRIFPEAIRPESEAIAFVDGDEPPVLLLTGADDTTVDPGNSTRLASRVRERGGRAEVRTYEDIGHIRIVGALARPLRGSAPVLDDIAAFIEAERAAGFPGCR